MISNKTVFLWVLLSLWIPGCGGEVREPGTNENVENGEVENTDKNKETAIKDSEPLIEVDQDQNHKKAEVPIKKSFVELLSLQVLTGKLSESGVGQPTLLTKENLPVELNHFTTVGDEILFQSALFLSDEKSLNPVQHQELYFTWPEEVGGDKITLATFTHQALDGGGQVIAQGNPQSVWHDVDQHRWYIHLGSLFSPYENYKKSQINLSDEQRVVLGIHLKSGAHRTLQIKFNLLGSLPLVKRSIRGQHQIAAWSPQSLIEHVSLKKLALHHEEIENPSQRPLTLWIGGGRSSSGLELQMLLRTSRFVGHSDREPDGPFWTYFTSKGRIELSSLEVTRKNQKTQIFSMTELNQGAVRLELNPLEKISFKWFVKPTSDTKKCSLPVPYERDFPWVKITLTPTLKFPQFPLQLKVKDHYKTETITARRTECWLFAQGKISGSWMRRMYLTESHLTADDVAPLFANSLNQNKNLGIPAYRVGEEEVPADPTFNLKEVGIEPTGPIQPFACQGIF